MYKIHYLISSTILVVAFVLQQQLGVVLNMIGIMDYYPSEVYKNSIVTFSEIRTNLPPLLC
jgi:hypothetical protein